MRHCLNIHNQTQSLEFSINVLIVLSLGKSSGAGESDEAYAADGANLHVYVALVKIAEGDPGAFEDLIQSVLIELANKLRAKDHKFRQQVSF